MSSISFKISFSGTPVEIEYPISVSIRSKRNYISWRQKVQDSELQLAYLEAPKIISHEAVEVVDYFKDMVETWNESIYTAAGNVIYSKKDNLIFTTVARNTKLGIFPVFFGHNLPTRHTKPSFIPWNKSLDPNIYIYSKSYSAIFCDLENEIDIKENIYRASYITYTANNEIVTELFRREPIFREETIYDYPIGVGEFRPIYRKEKVSGGWKFTFPFLNGERIFYREHIAGGNQISISENLNLTQQWPLEITGNSFTLSNIFDPSQNVYYAWSKPETTFYFPYYPFLTNKKQGQYINEKTFLVQSRNIIIDSSKNLHFTFKVIRDGVVVLGQTTQEHLLNKRLSGSFKDKNIVRWESFTGGVDYSSGAVAITNAIPLHRNDLIIAEYCVRDDRNEKQIANINPVHEKWLEEGSIFYFATPDTQQDQTVINWVKLKNTRNENQGNSNSNISYDLIIVDSNNAQVKDNYKTLSLKVLIENEFVYNIYTKSYIQAGEKFLPLALVSFKKNKYISNTKHKDLRVFAGFKEDMPLLEKGRDFLFSNLMNRNGYVGLDLKNQVAVYIDRTGIPNYDLSSANQHLTTIEAIIARSLPNAHIGHLKYKDCPVIKQITADKTAKSYSILYKKPSNLFTKIRLYLSEDRIMYPQSPTNLGAVNITGTPTSEMVMLAEFDTSLTLPDSVDLDVPQNLFAQFTNDDDSLVSAFSPIFNILAIEG